MAASRCEASLLLAAATLAAAAAAAASSSTEFHVALSGDDGNDGSAGHPFRTVQHAAAVAQGGDVVTVHAGTYRERVHPPTGGVTFQAAAGDAVTISGAEPATGWAHVGADTWRLDLPSAATFGNFNPYSDRLRGDWFDDQGLVHHSGAVYVGDLWLKEAATLAQVLGPVAPGAEPRWFGTVGGDNGTYLVNLLWIAPRVSGAAVVSAGLPSWRYGTKPYNGTEGPCAAFILNGDVLRFDNVDFGTGASALDLRAAAQPGAGAALEVRAGDRWGPLLGSASIPSTGDWEAWANFSVPLDAPVSGLQNISLVFLSPGYSAGTTSIYAQFPGVADPNAAAVEINVRQTVFYPTEPFIDNITVRGFTLERAATQWAPPSSEQIGIIGTHWSKGWVIEDNEVRDSACSCVALGKYGDGYDNTNDEGQADPYTACVYRALAFGWHKDRVGSHTVRGNYIHHCGQTGVVGSLGGAFSTVAENLIHDCHWEQSFSGAEMAGIKLHAAVDAVIRDNHIFNCSGLGVLYSERHHLRSNSPRPARGQLRPLSLRAQLTRLLPSLPPSPQIWLDWMAQGTMVVGNLFHDNTDCDIFTEVDHGPYTMANNLFLGPSPGVCANSAGAAYVHNLVAVGVQQNAADGRLTPVLVPHETDIAQIVVNNNGDHRMYNNLLVAPAGFAVESGTPRPSFGSGNVYAGASTTGPSKWETAALVNKSFDAGLALTEAGGVWTLQVNLDALWPVQQPRALVTTALLGNASVPNQGYTLPDASPFAIDRDYFGRPRNAANPFPGAIEATGAFRGQVWPKPAP